MNILFDHQTFSLQRYGGISRYFFELIKGVQSSKTHHASVALRYSDNEYIKHSPDIKHTRFLNGIEFPRKTLTTFYLNNYFSLKQIRKKKFDVFHPTYYNTYFLEALGKKPFVFTFHDTIHELFSERYEMLSLDKKIRRWKRTLTEKASRIIAVSEATKKDIVKFYGADPEKIEVIHLASSVKVMKDVLYPDLIGKPYLLFTGNREAYKNFDFLLKSIVGILHCNKDLIFICAGGGAFTEAEIILINKLKLQGQVKYIGIANNESLTALYVHAQAFIFPSLYEGFGIPVLESFACNCPCLLSNTSSLPEVGGDAALYFNPEDENSIIRSVNNILNDGALRKELIGKGAQRVQNFSWNKTVEHTMTLYRSVIKEHGS